MDKLDLNKILNRKKIENQIIEIINNFYSENDKTICVKNKYKSGIYIYGDSGIGKTTFINNIIKNLNYDIIYYDNTIIRNKQLIDSISSLNMSNNNVLSLFNNCLIGNTTQINSVLVNIKNIEEYNQIANTSFKVNFSTFCGHIIDNTNIKSYLEKPGLLYG